MKKILSITLSLCLLVTAMSFTACGENTIKVIKQGVRDIGTWVDEGLLMVDEYEAQGYITADQAQLARRILNDITTAKDAFLKYGQSIKKIDWKSKNDLIKLFAAVIKGVDEFQAKAGPTIVLALKALSAAGVVKIDNPQQLFSRVSAAIHGFNIAVGMITTRLEDVDVEEPKQEKQPDQPQSPPPSACLIPFPGSYQFARA